MQEAEEQDHVRKTKLGRVKSKDEWREKQETETGIESAINQSTNQQSEEPKLGKQEKLI